MPAKSDVEFEKELRVLCDGFFERPGLPNYPFGDLCEGQLTREQLRAFYAEQCWWESSLVFSQKVLPLLLKRCPDKTGLLKLRKLIEAEYGAGDPHTAHLLLAKQFLQALGVPDDDLSLELPESEKIRKVVLELENKRFIELLANNFLGPETVGPKVFCRYADMLREQFGMTIDQVKFFTVHGEQDEKDSDVLFELTATYARTEEEQEIARRALREHYERPRVRALCAIRPITFSYQNPSA